MEKISSSIDFALKDLRQALVESDREKRQYNKTSEYQYKPEQSRFKLVLWFHDGNRRTFYSYDNVYFNKVAHLDEWKAIIKLIDLTKKYGGKFLYRNNNREHIEGSPIDDRVVILEFDNNDNAKKWYNSTEYQEARNIRKDIAEASIYILDPF
jgi:uncharacterized protein (DUF1330 family)